MTELTKLQKLRSFTVTIPDGSSNYVIESTVSTKIVEDGVVIARWEEPADMTFDDALILMRLALQYQTSECATTIENNDDCTSDQCTPECPQNEHEDHNE